MAVQVLVITSVKPQPTTDVSAKVIIGVGSISSIAVAVPVPAGVVSPPHSTVTSVGQVITGGVVSKIVITVKGTADKSALDCPCNQLAAVFSKSATPTGIPRSPKANLYSVLLGAVAGNPSITKALK